MRKVTCLLFTVILLSACSQNSEPSRQQKYFFDIAGYFQRQAEILKNKKVLKTVQKNGVSETKTLEISDWQQELALFTEADINKPAWKNSYKVDSGANKLLYTAKEADLRVQKITINFANEGQVKQIAISTQSTNLLYHTTENLLFVADSAYRIEKHQKVLLLGANDYLINGKF